MSTHIEFDLAELRKIAQDKDSCVVEHNIKQNIALQPRCLGNIKGSIKTLLNYKIGKYDNEMFNGILLSYKNLNIQEVGSIRNDNPEVYYPVQADYFIFRPLVGATLKGVVNKKSPTHLGILVHRVFNVVIPNPTEEPEDKWIGASVHEGQQIVFRIAFVDLYRALPYIRGELDERWLNLDADGNYEELETAQPLNTFVHFDKTKPYVQKQMADSRDTQENITTSTSRKRKLESSDDSTSSSSDNELQNKEVTRKKATPKKVTNKEVTPKKVTSKEVTPKKVSSKEVTPKKVTSKEVTPKKVTRKEATPKGPAAKKRKQETCDSSLEVMEVQMSVDETTPVEDGYTKAEKENKSARRRKSVKAN